MQASQRRMAAAFCGLRGAAEEAAAVQARLRCAVRRLGGLRAAAALRAWHGAVAQRQATAVIVHQALRYGLCSIFIYFSFNFLVYCGRLRVQSKLGWVLVMEGCASLRTQSVVRTRVVEPR
jgi:hypothetical protein